MNWVWNMEYWMDVLQASPASRVGSSQMQSRDQSDSVPSSRPQTLHYHAPRSSQWAPASRLTRRVSRVPLWGFVRASPVGQSRTRSRQRNPPVLILAGKSGPRAACQVVTTNCVKLCLLFVLVTDLCLLSLATERHGIGIKNHPL